MEDNTDDDEEELIEDGTPVMDSDDENEWEEDEWDANE